MFSKVIVGFDGSEQARDALSLGASLAAHDGELTVCCVHRFKMLSARVDPAAPHLDHEEAEQCIKEASQLLDSPLTVRPLLRSSELARRWSYGTQLSSSMRTCWCSAHLIVERQDGCSLGA